MRVTAVAPANARFVLNVKWSDGSKSRVDLTGLVHQSRHFQVFADDPGAFRAVRPVGFGSGIGWDNGLEYSAATLKTLADEQRPASGKYLRTFTEKFHLNVSEIAHLLQVDERTVRNYSKARALPNHIAFALRRFENDPTIFAAHYRPVERRGRGRPKSVAKPGNAA